MLEADIAKQGEDVSRLVKCFERGVRRFEADVNQDNIITTDELCRFLKDQIAQDAPGVQPEEWGFNINSGEGEIIRRAKTTTPSASRLPSSESEDFFRAVDICFRQKRIIPFLGDGVYSGGPLSAFELVGALVQSTTQQAGFKVDERYPLATAAEYLHQVLGAQRSIFLDEFRHILVQKSRRTGRIATHDFILSMATPWLVVSATYDWTLETALTAAGKPFAVVAHIIHAADRKEEGKLLIVRHDGGVSTEIRLADDWVLDDLGNTKERVIYKLVGSPYLHDFLEPERVDTVVITEADHMEFLGRLQNEHARVPSAFTPCFKKSALLFLGYNLDVWHYRLIGHIFSDSGIIKTGPRYAVRTATSPIEERFWTRLVADKNRLQSDCEAFVLSFGER